MPGMIPDLSNTNAPWFGPGRPLIIADPQKLSYFAQANAVRAGVMGTYGSLSGLGRLGDDSAPGDERAMESSAAFTADTSSLELAESMYGAGAVTAPPVAPPPLLQGNANGVVPASYGLPPPPMVSATTGNVTTANGTNSLSNFFSSLNNFLRPAPTQSFVPQYAPSPLPWIIGIGVLGIGAVVLLKHKKMV